MALRTGLTLREPTSKQLHLNVYSATRKRAERHLSRLWNGKQGCRKAGKSRLARGHSFAGLQQIPAADRVYFQPGYEFPQIVGGKRLPAVEHRRDSGYGGDRRKIVRDVIRDRLNGSRDDVAAELAHLDCIAVWIGPRCTGKLVAADR